MQIRTAGIDDAMLLKDVRLRALADAPYAFGGARTLAEESALPDSHWRQLAAELGGEDPAWRDRCVTYFVVDDQGDDAGDVCGSASCYLCSAVAGRAYFSAAWVDPRHRRRGIGRRLVRRAIAWATAHGADHLKLWVDDTNPGAAAFYRALGFEPTGEHRPVGPDSTAGERSMTLL